MTEQHETHDCDDCKHYVKGGRCNHPDPFRDKDGNYTRWKCHGYAPKEES